MRISTVVVLCLSTLTLYYSAADAAQVETSFEGVVNTNNSLAGSPAIGSAFSGDFIIDASILTGEGPNCTGTSLCWSGADTSWSLNGTTYTYSTVAVPSAFDVRFSETNAAPGAGSDILAISLGGGGFLDTDTLTLTDPTGTAFENGGAVNLFASGEFSDVPLCLTGITCATNRFWSGPITLISSVGLTTPSAVPLPAAAWLFTSGLVALAGFACRKSIKFSYSRK